MRTITWLQISDFHLRDSQAWAQDVVLSAMCTDISRRREGTHGIDFVLATGDLAFAGKANEYVRAAAFFDEVLRVAGIPRQRIFFIPGNHDVDRDRQKMCFAGARHVLQSQNEVDAFLGAPDEVATLLQRQEHYYRFQNGYLPAQERTWTSDRLGYVSTLTVEGLRIAIVGLNTSWLAEGGLADHGRLLAGERQIIDALRIADQTAPHIMIAMGHHPFHLLNDFDRRPAQRRIEEACHFFHCGHLHDPETRDAVRGGVHCLTVAAGASFDSRHTQNAYSVVALDVMNAARTVKTVQYKPVDDAFSYESVEAFPLIINKVMPCGVGELGRAIELYRPDLASFAYYMAALLVEAKAEVPIVAGKTYAFGSIELMEDQPASELKAATIAFMKTRNPLRLMGKGMTLDDFLSRYGDAVERFGRVLGEISEANALRARLDEREADARALAGAEPLKPFAHTLALLRELATAQEWTLLHEQAERHLESADEAAAREAKRMLALALAHSEEEAEKRRAADLYRSLAGMEEATPDDLVALASLLAGFREHNDAKSVVLSGMGRFPDAADSFVTIGHAIVEATGDRPFRDELNARRAARRMG
jgi:predicted phosphodiesterase